jgi:hypothetical protein
MCIQSTYTENIRSVWCKREARRRVPRRHRNALEARKLNAIRSCYIVQTFWETTSYITIIQKKQCNTTRVVKLKQFWYWRLRNILLTWLKRDTSLFWRIPKHCNCPMIRPTATGITLSIKIHHRLNYFYIIIPTILIPAPRNFQARVKWESSRLSSF